MIQELHSLYLAGMILFWLLFGFCFSYRPAEGVAAGGGGTTLLRSFQSDFSGTQGSNGWYYKYIDEGSMIHELPTYDGDSAWLIPNTYCSITNAGFHPNTLEECATPDLYCSPLVVWENPVPILEANYSVVISASHISPMGDGVFVKIRANSLALDTYITPFEETAHTYDVANLTLLEIQLDPKSSCNFDMTSLAIDIFQTLPPSPSSTPSTTSSPSVSPSPSSSATPSSSSTASSTTSPSSSITISPTRTSSRTPSPSQTGICNDVRNWLYGTTESVNGDTRYTIQHGVNVYHTGGFLCGQNPSCEDTGTSCICTYTNGMSLYCSMNRMTTITYVYGANQLLATGQNPGCHYHFLRQFTVPSPTPTPSITSSFTPTFTPSASPSQTGLCNDLKNYGFGKTHTSSNNGSAITIVHGSYITQDYLPNFPMLIGVFQGCVDYGSYCLCIYGNGYNQGCTNGVARSAIVNISQSMTQFQTNFSSLSSDCVYSFNAGFQIPSVTSTNTPSWTRTASWTPTGTWTSSITRTGTASASWTGTPTFTMSGTSSWTRTATSSWTASATPSRTPKGICNDVKTYLFGRLVQQIGTYYKINHGVNATQWYYPGYDMAIGRRPVCIEYDTNCTCAYNNGDDTFCEDARKSVVVYKYGLTSEPQTTLVSDINPVCVYQFVTTFHPPYFSHTPSVTSTVSASSTASPSPPPPFVRGPVKRLEIPADFPHLPPNASTHVLTNIASSYVNNLNLPINGNGTSTDAAVETLVNTLNVLASSLVAAGVQTQISVNNSLFSWVALPAPINGMTAPIDHSSFESVLPPLAPGMVYSMTTRHDPSLRRNGTDPGMPQFSINALSTSNSEVGVTGLAVPLMFSVKNIALNASMTLECVYWNGTDWNSDGCTFVNGSCFCTHFTEFSARFVSIATTNQQIFGNAANVYSASGFAKYAVIYGVLLGIVGSLLVVYGAFTWLDVIAEHKYRVVVEDIEEVCAVLGYPKPLRDVVQPRPALPRATRDPFCRRLCTAWGMRLLYQHSYLSLLFKYDPRLPRTFRLLLVVVILFHTLFLTTFLYGYSKVEAEMTIAESIVLSVITAVLNVPFLKLIFAAINKAGKAEYISRFPSYAHEYLRRRRFEDALASTSTETIEWVARRIALGVNARAAIKASPRRDAKRTSHDQISGMNLLETQQIADDSADNLAVYMCLSLLPCLKKRNKKGKGLEMALDITQGGDQHWTQPLCNCLPTKSRIGFFVSCVCFSWIGWCINYLLLFTAAQSSDAMNKIATSFGISQAMSILATQPLTMFLTLAGTWAFDLWKRRRSTPGGQGQQHSIGYFADPLYVKQSTSLSGTWAYWIFMYAGSKVSLGGSNVEQTMLGASNQRVALAWLEGENTQSTQNVASRDAAITTLYLYLRGLRKPVRKSMRHENTLELAQRALEDMSGAKIGIVVSEEKEEMAEEVSHIVGKILT